jgi:hypothetical protein
MKCTYCKSSVIVPGDGDHEAADSIANKTAGIEKVITLVRSGQKIEAIKVFREVTQTSLAQAKRAVDALELGEAIDITRFLSSEAIGGQSLNDLNTDGRSSPRKLIGCAVAAASLLIAGVTVMIIFLTQKKNDTVNTHLAGPREAFEQRSGITSKPFADPVLTFGQKGIGPGMLNDPRYVGADRNGNIFAGDYSDGRINVFDATGKFLQQINIGKKTIIQGMAATPDGTLYISYNGKIHRLDAQGNDTLQSHTDKNGHLIYFENITLGADGSLVAAGQGEQIIRFDPKGAVNLVIPRAFSSVTEDSELDIHLAVDGLGNIYALGSFNTLVLKYSPEGKYLDQFGGKTQHPAEGVDPGRFQAPDTIAVDGHGRIYVSDIWGIQVFGSNGQYLQFFKVDGVAFGMAFDLNNDLYIASNKPAIIKLRIQAP